MSRAYSLDELVNLNVVDPAFFGSKAAMSLELYKLINDINFDYSFVKISVPNFFVVPVDVSLTTDSVRMKYQELVHGLDSKKIVLARSNDPDESPGKFSTLPSLYNPESNSNFDNWLEAAVKVKESGARSVMGQILCADLVKFGYERDYAAKDYAFKTIECFGPHTTGFFGNSTNLFYGKNPNITACWGIPSKIARGDMDVSLVLMDYENDVGVKVVNLNQNYCVDSFVPFNQMTIDVVALNNPKKFLTVEGSSDALFGRGYCDFMSNKISLPFEKLKQAELILNILYELKLKLNSEVEIEGIVKGNTIHLFQLRKYELPKTKSVELTVVDNDKLIYKTDKSALGWNSFSGDLVVSENIINVNPEDIFLYCGTHDIEGLRKYNKLIFETRHINGLYQASHVFGDAIQSMVKLNKSGIEPIIVMDRIGYDLRNRVSQGNYKDRLTDIDNSQFILKNVTVEACDRKLQIFFN